MHAALLRPLAVLAGLSAAAGAGQGVVVTNTYLNLDADGALSGVPVTFSRIGADGDFTRGITPRIGGRRVPAQVDVLRRGADGSIRHALVSMVLPRTPEGGKLRIDWLNEKPPAPPAFQWGFDREKIDVRLVLAREKGGRLGSDVGRILRGGWSASRRVRVLHDGPVMKEVEVHDVPTDAAGKADEHVEVYWRVRAFTGQRSVRVAAVVERCKDRKKSGPEPVQYKFASVKLLCGEKTLYEEGPYDHLDQTRFRILAWTDGRLEDIERRPDFAYWHGAGFVPKYRWVEPKTAAEVDAMYSRRHDMRRMPRRRQGILENGIILRHMPGTGGRWDLGPYPFWVAAYLLGGGTQTYRAILHADGNGGGAFFIHVRQKGRAGYDVFTVTQPAQDRGYRIDLYRLPDGSRTPTQPDHAHMPSIGYVSYLLTGDKFYAEELSFWAAFQMGEWPHKGLKWHSMDRSFAWSLRQVVDAAFILPDGDGLGRYFTKGVDQCMDEMTEALVNSPRRVHSPPAGNFQCSGRQNWVNALRCSAWQYAWVVWALHNAANKGFAKAGPVRDWAAEYVIGLYTSDDEFKAPDGKTYRYDPRDAMPYSTAIALLETKIVPLAGGKKGVRQVRKIRHLDNFGEVWYYTKLNVDNGWYGDTGLRSLPDANGVWPLREDGFGGGFMYWAYGKKRSRHFNYHLLAMTALAAAIEADVKDARKAWDLMMRFGGKEGEYGIQQIPRTPIAPPRRNR